MKVPKLRVRDLVVCWHCFADLLFPRGCVVCGETLGEGPGLLCLGCLADLPRTPFTGLEENPISRLFWGRVPVVRATSLFFFNKGSPYRHMMHRFKYRGEKEIGYELGKMLGYDIGACQWGIDVVVPVPLHPRKERLRGYNQSEWIARGVAAALGVTCDTTSLKRVVASTTQTRKSRFERWKNVSSIFALGPGAQSLHGQHILLVDDVLTTGATLEACSHELLNIEGATVSVATLAVA